MKVTVMVLAEAVAERLREYKRLGRTVSLWLRDNKMNAFERQCKTPEPTNGINDSHVNDSVINGTGVYIGGIAGETNALEIRGCEVSGTTVIGSSVSVGGIAGATASATTVSGCHVKPYTPEGGATVKIIVTGTNNIGGIVGYSKGAVSGVSADNANVTGTGNH